MSLTRRWGIIGSIAVAQLGIIIGYQALVSPGPEAACAQEIVPPGGLPAPSGSPPKAAQHPVCEQLPQGIVAVPSPAPNLKPGNELIPVAPTFSLSIPPLPPEASGQIVQVGAKDPPMPPVQNSGQAPLPPASLTPAPPTVPQNNQPQLPAPDVAPKGEGSKPQGVQEVPQPTVSACPWNLTMEIIDGRTHLTARNGNEVQFKVECEKLDLQSPHGRMEASGKVKIASECLDGTCDRLTISWQEDVVVLEKVQMKCKLEGHEADLQAPSLRLRLSRVIPPTPPVTPVSATESRDTMRPNEPNAYNPR